MESLDAVLGLAADLCGDVPAGETFVVPVGFPDLINDELVGLQFVGHLACVPVPSAVVQPETELHPVLVGEAEEQLDQIHGRHVASLAEKVLARVGEELAVAAADEDHRVDPHGLHVPEVQVPLLRSPVLVRNVVRDLVQECPGDRDSIAFRHNQFTLYSVIGLEPFRVLFMIRGARCKRRHRSGRDCHSGALQKRSSVCHNVL